jgi:hypothetical protein
VGTDGMGTSPHLGLRRLLLKDRARFGGRPPQVIE